MIRCPSAVIGNFSAFAALLIATNVAQATPNHSFTIKNNSGNTISIASVHGYCIKSIDMPRSIPSGGTITVHWVDSNNIGEIQWMAAQDPNGIRTRAVHPTSKGIDGVACTNAQKWVSFQVNNYEGVYGVVHRKISGTFYNGQFWAASLGITPEAGWQWRDSDQVPDPDVSATCSNMNPGCFGKFGEMVSNGKNDYNWPRLYQTEDGYQFQFK